MTDINLNNETSNNESGMLAKLWRKIIAERHLTNALHYLISRYVKESGLQNNNVKVVKHKTRNTLVNNICAKEMTFKVFLDLIFNFLRMKRVDITITLYAHNDESSTHTISLSGEITKAQQSDTNEDILKGENNDLECRNNKENSS